MTPTTPMPGNDTGLPANDASDLLEAQIREANFAANISRMTDDQKFAFLYCLRKHASGEATFSEALTEFADYVTENDDCPARREEMQQIIRDCEERERDQARAVAD